MKRLLISVGALVLLVAPQLILGADLDDLKAANERMVKAANSLDAAAIASMIHPGFVLFGRDSAFALVAPTEPKQAEATLRTLLQNGFATAESLNTTPVNTQYRVIGNTGIVWGYSTVVTKPKGGPLQTTQSRVTWTWITVVQISF